MMCKWLRTLSQFYKFSKQAKMQKLSIRHKYDGCTERRNRTPPSHIWNMKNRYPLTRKSDVLTKTLHQNSSISHEEWFHVRWKYKQMFSMTISIDSFLMIAVLSTKMYTNHPHETLLFRGPYTFTLDLFNVLTTLWPIGTPIHKL